MRVRGRDLRRALLAVLLRAERPLTIAEIVERLRRDERIDVDWLVDRTRRSLSARPPSVAKYLSDLLRHQVAAGRAVRVSQGVYVVNRQGLSSSSIHRCLNWHRIRSGEIRGR